MSKRPKVKEEPTPKKSPKAQQVPSDDTSTPMWKISMLDLNGPWCWKNIGAETLWDTLFESMRFFESMTWAEIKRNGSSHTVPVKNLCREAVSRLKTIQMDDIDEMFSLRLSGKKRVWGIRQGSSLKLIWWDPEHQICPSSKKNT